MDDLKSVQDAQARAAYNEYMREYRATHKDKIKEINRRYYIKKYKEYEKNGNK